MRKTLLTALAGIMCASAAQAFSLSSPTFVEGKTLPPEHVFNSFGCDGTNHSPAISWRDAPAGTKSFAVTIYDPDAPTGSGWWHWLVANIPASAQGLPADAGTGTGLPAGAVQTRTDFGKPGFGGACPPKGDKPHHYILTVYALDLDKLPVEADSSGAYVGFNLHFHTLGKASITALYGR
jgi:Raf kinase inhibitor-like YbhB/YbcL family protein